MVEFGNHLYDFDQIKNPEQMEENMKILRKKAHAVSFAYRDSIGKSIHKKTPSVRLRRELAN